MCLNLFLNKHIRNRVMNTGEKSKLPLVWVRKSAWQ